MEAKVKAAYERMADTFEALGVQPLIVEATRRYADGTLPTAERKAAKIANLAIQPRPGAFITWHGRNRG